MLPKGWRREALGECTKFLSGNTPSKEIQAYWSGDFPWVTVRDMKTPWLDKAGLTLTPSGKAVASLAPANSILVVTRGMALLKDLPISLTMREVAFNQDIKAIVPNEGLDARFLAYQIQSKKNVVLDMVDTAGHGTGRLDTDLLKSVDLVLPPMAEQRRIAEVLTTWDRAIVKAERLLENSSKRKRGLTRDLVLGQRRFPQFKAPWQQLSFRDVLKEVKRRVDWDDDQDYPLISVRRRSEGAFHRETLKGSEILTKKLNYAYEGEFLVSKMQVVHGAMAVVPPELDGMFISDSYLAFQSADEERFDINFIGWLSTTQQMYNAVRRCSYGVHIEKMTFDLEMFLNEKLHMPTDLAEQRLICTVLASAQNEIKSATNHLEQLRQEKAALMSQLLTGKRRVKLLEAETEAQA